MKSSRKLFIAVSGLTATLAIATPIITSCSSIKDLKIISKGNGENFVTSSNSEFNIKFNDALEASMNSNETSYKQFKKAIADRLLYNWYKKIADAGNVQTFKDNWSSWKDSAKKSYDDKVQSYKNSHGNKWEYFFQNEVLDPVGGTKDAYIFNQIVTSIRGAMADLVFGTSYLAYTSSIDSINPINSIVTSFTPDTFSNSNKWLNVDFYAGANSNYNPKSKSAMDDIYALIQKEAFEQWTQKDHPISVAMSLWKYAAPTEGMRSIYSDKVPNNASSSGNGLDQASLDTVTIERDDPSGFNSLSATYAVPAFPQYVGGKELNANGKFYNLLQKLNATDSMIDENGICNIKNSSQITDDNATSIIVTTNNMYSSLDETFAGTVASLYAYFANKGGIITDIKDKLLPYDKENLSPKNGLAKNTDILKNFMFSFDDTRVWSGNALTSLGTSLNNLGNYVLDLSKTFESEGTASNLSTPTKGNNFRSHVFNSLGTGLFNYYSQGIQYVVSGLRLTTTGSSTMDLPYALIRDSFGVHLIGLNGFVNYDPTTGYDNQGYLLKAPDITNGDTKILSQGRMNIMLKAQSLNQTANKTGDTGLEINSPLKTFFTDNLDDIIISMAHKQTKRAATDDTTTPIFDDSGIFKKEHRDVLYKLINSGNDYYLLQSTITAWNDASKKYYGDRYSNVSASVLARTPGFFGATSDNYANALTTAFPFLYNNAETATDDSNLFLGHSWFDIFLLGNWITPNKKDDIGKVDAKDDLFINSIYSSKKNLSDNGGSEINNVKKTFTDNITEMISSLQITKGNVSKSGMMKYSEHLNVAWNDDGTNVIQNGFYLALHSLLSSNSFENSAKLKVLESYWTNFNQGATALNPSQFSYATSQYFASKIFSESTPNSYYLPNNAIIDETTYKNIYRQEMLQLFGTGANQVSFANYGDNFYNYLLYLDTLAYLLKNNAKQLMDYLKSYLPYGTEGDLVWLTEDNINGNPNFGSDDYNNKIGDYFIYSSNYNGNYDSTYLPTSAISNGIKTYIANSAYYNYAPLPFMDTTSTPQQHSVTNFAMGFAGLVTSSSSTSAITSNISKALFTDTYNTKVDNNKHIGGWNKYTNLTELTDYIKKLNSITDIQNITNNLAAANKDNDFTNYVVNWVVNRNTYQANDPEVLAEKAEVGKPVTPKVMRERLLGISDNSEITSKYAQERIGLQNYYDDLTTGENHKDIVNNLFAKFGDANQNGTGAKLLYNDTTTSHLIYTDDNSANVARVAVIQLNSTDVIDQDHLLKALNFNNTDTAKYIFYAIASQIAMNSTLQTQALNEVINTQLDGNKFTVYDRNFNDDLTQMWVKDWKSTN